MPRLTIVLFLVATIAACSGDRLTVSEYAAEIEAMVDVMGEQFVALDADWESQSPTLSGALDYWDRRLAIRTGYLDDLGKIEPPAGIADMHATALEVFEKITAADEALAARVATFEEVTEHRPWLATPEGEASLAVLEEVYTFCRSSQAEFDATAERAPLTDVPWVPAEMKEVVKVAFGCPP